MANDNRLNKTGLRYFLSKLNGFFAKQTDLDALDARVDEIETEGGEPNTIESISVNGTSITPDAQKNVEISVPTAVSELTNDGDGTSGSRFATEEYVAANGGKIDTISVNGTQQTITNKNVDLSIPTLVSDLTNDSGFQTASEVDAAIAAQVSRTYKPGGSVAFANLPSLLATNEGKVYNITDAFTTTADFVEGAGKTHPAGTNVVIINTGTEQNPVYKYDVLAGMVDLSDYWNTTNLPALTTAEIDDVWNSVFNPTTP